MDLLLRVSVILGVTWVASRCLPRATAATRHLLWHLAVVGVLVAPFVFRMTPPFEAPLPTPEMVVFVQTPDLTTPVLRPATRAAARLDPWILWPIGSIAVLLWYATGHLVGARRARRARPADADIQSMADTLAGRRVDVLIDQVEAGPFVRGILRAVIVLPATAEAWSATRLRAVLLHELAHVRRGDCRVQLLAQIACAAYWFDPLIWVASRQLRIERERACDDEVLARGEVPSAYAADLLDLARAQSRLASSAVLAMARPGELEGRLRAILAPGRARTPRRLSRLAATILICALAGVVLAARTTRVAREADATPAAISAAHDDHPDPERAAMKLALDSRPDAIPGLIAALNDSDSQVREKAALGLGWRTDPRAFAPLVTALSDRDSQVREKAAIALGSLADPRAIAPLEAALNDPDRQVREKAASGLMLLRMGGNPDQNGREVRAALSGIVNGLLQLTK